MAMNVEAYLKFFYPFLYAENDNRKVSPEDIAIALQIASTRVPECLSDDEKLQAQAHYAAYTLGTIIRNKLSGGGSDIAIGEAGAVKMIKDGDSEIQYYGPTAFEIKNSVNDFAGGLSTAFDRYNELASKCVMRLTTVRR